jgi:hypothetical protein
VSGTERFPNLDVQVVAVTINGPRNLGQQFQSQRY